MRMLGAKVIVTPKAGKGTGMVAKAAELAEKHGWFLCKITTTRCHHRSLLMIESQLFVNSMGLIFFLSVDKLLN